MFNRKIGTISWKIHYPYEGMYGDSAEYIEKTVTGNGYIDLLTAKRGSLSNLTLFGGTEQRNLPSGYTQLEYIESTGTQYIDTGIKMTTADDVNMLVQFTSDSPVQNFYGSRNLPASISDGSWNLFYNVVSGSLDALTIRLDWNGSRNLIDFTPSIALNTDTTIRLYSSSSYGKAVVNGTSYSGDVTKVNALYNTVLFGCNNARDITCTPLRIKEYSVKRNDILIQNLIPCRRNSDNEVGMYDSVTGTFFTNQGTGDFIAGADVVPTPDNPMDIICNNGVLKVSPNLFDKNNLYADHYIEYDGRIVSVSTWDVSAKIPVIPNAQYTLSGVIQVFNDIYHAFYDSNDQCLLTIATAVGTTVMTAPANASYLRLSIRKVSGDKETVQLEPGSTATAYRPYGQIYTDGTVETVQATGKNLFDVDNNLLEGYYISSSTGILAQSSDGSSSCFKDFLPSAPNVTYTMSRLAPTVATWMRMWAYDKDKNPISSVFNSSTGATEVTGTTPNGTAYIRCSFGSIPHYSQNVQLELGSTATTYEPYYNGGSATAEMLLKVGNYKDTQEVLAGAVTRNVGIKVLDGTEEWNRDAVYSRFFISIADMYAGSTVRTLVMLSTHYLCISDGRPISEVPNNSFYSAADRNAYFKTTNYTTVADWKQYLAQQYASGTPVIIVYPLATATTETVTGQNLNVKRGTNKIEIIQASIDNLGISATYLSRE